MYATLTLSRTSLSHDKKEENNALAKAAEHYGLPPKLQDSLQGVGIRESVATIKEGAWVTRWSRNLGVFGIKKTQIFVRVDMEALRLLWTATRSSKIQRSASLIDIDEIVLAVDSMDWKKFSTAEKQVGFELQLKRRRIRLLVDSVPSWRLWLRGIFYARHKAQVKRRYRGIDQDTVLRQQWLLADVDNSGSIQFNECVMLLKSLQFHADINYIRFLFQTSIDDGSYVLEYDEFEKFLTTILTHQALKTFFYRFCSDEAVPLISLQDFRRFLDTVQLANAQEIEMALPIVNEYKDPYRITSETFPPALREKLTLYGFCRFITSKHNYIFIPEKRLLYQDMTQSLFNYSIKTTCFWTFPGDEFNETAVLNRLEGLLNMGYRGFLIHCCLDSNDELYTPIGTNGNGRLSLEGLFKKISNTAFKNNPYPVLLLLDVNQCNSTKLLLIDLCIKTVFGSSLVPVATPQDKSQLYSLKLNTLCNKVIIGQMGNQSSYSHSISSEKSDELIIEQIFSAQLSELKNMKITPPQYIENLDFTDGHYEKEEYPVRYKRETSSELSQTISSEKLNTAVLIGERLRVHISDKQSYYKSGDCTLYCLRPSDLHRIASQPGPCACTLKLALSSFFCVEPDGHFAVCKPANPVDAWICGMQCVPIPFYAYGLASVLNIAKFEENGACGYVLKPICIPNDKTSPDNIDAQDQYIWKDSAITCSITVLGGQQLPRTGCDSTHSRGIKDNLSPFVTVSVQGLRRDRVSYRTECITNNGLNPSWPPKKLTFNVAAPNVAYLLFEVGNFNSSRTETIAWAGIPLACVRSGLRWIPLRNTFMYLVPWSGLLVSVELHANKLPTRA